VNTLQDYDNMAPYYGQNKLSPENMQEDTEMEMKMLPCMVYPEVFYKLQPYIMMVCDHAEANGIEMPTQEMIESITDNIYEDIVRNNPDIAEYVRSQEQQGRSGMEQRQTSLAVQGPWFRRRVRRRGLFRDLIDILLLSEFSRRRRRRFSPFF
jgi:hypothetical protein